MPDDADTNIYGNHMQTQVPSTMYTPTMQTYVEQKTSQSVPSSSSSRFNFRINKNTLEFINFL